MRTTANPRAAAARAVLAARGTPAPRHPSQAAPLGPAPAGLRRVWHVTTLDGAAGIEAEGRIRTGYNVDLDNEEWSHVWGRAPRAWELGCLAQDGEAAVVVVALIREDRELLTDPATCYGEDWQVHDGDLPIEEIEDLYELVSEEWLKHFHDQIQDWNDDEVIDFILENDLRYREYYGV